MKTEKVNVWLAEPALAGHYQFNPWVGVGAGIGYRHMLDESEKETRDLNSPIYQVKLKIFLSEVYRSVRDRKNTTGR
jgi:hypothetical protein